MSEDKFDYTYSAPTEAERIEAEEIRRRYSLEKSVKTSEENAIEKLRALDKRVKFPVQFLAAVLGILGTLMLGVGMCFAMNVFELKVNLVPLGVVVGLAGIALVIADYFIYKAVLNARKKKYADEILSITDKFLNVK